MADPILMLGNNPGEAKLWKPDVEEGIEWSTARQGEPGRLKFSVLKDDTISFQEGSPVRLSKDGKDLFFGFVFVKSRSKDGRINVTAYDQLRYLKNKASINYAGWTASALITALARDFNLKTGSIADTKYVIARRSEENMSLFDIIGNALDLTLTNRKEMYVLYDDFGALTLRNIADMRVGNSGAYLMIDEAGAEDFNYTSSIDSDTYNRVRLRHEDTNTGKITEYEAKDTASMGRWGVLQYFETLKDGENGQAKAEALLSLYNKKTRNLKIRNAFGDTRVRAGSMIIVNLGLGDIDVKNFMLVEKCTHRFKKDEHFMDLTLRGGDFIG